MDFVHLDKKGKVNKADRHKYSQMQLAEIYGTQGGHFEDVQSEYTRDTSNLGKISSTNPSTNWGNDSDFTDSDDEVQYKYEKEDFEDDKYQSKHSKIVLAREKKNPCFQEKTVILNGCYN